MPFLKIKKGKNRGKYRSPSGRIFTRGQVARYYARGGSFDQKPSFYCDAPVTRDPTNTLDIRKRYRSLIEFRWRKVRGATRQALQASDMMGLASRTSVMALALSGHGEEGKIKTFQSWFDSLLSKFVLETNGRWLIPMVAAAYERALEQTQARLKTAAKPDDSVKVVEQLSTLAFAELQGIAEAVSQRAVRNVTLGLIHEVKPGQLYRSIAADIDKVGIERSRAMIDVIVVKTHATASLDTMRAAGETHTSVIPETLPRARMRADENPNRDPETGQFTFGGGGGGAIGEAVAIEMSRTLREAERKVREKLAKMQLGEAFKDQDEELVEVLTAGDDEVCELCEDISADGPYLIDDAYDLIPAHPHCRCAFVPVEDRRFAPIEREE